MMFVDQSGPPPQNMTYATPASAHVRPQHNTCQGGVDQSGAPPYKIVYVTPDAGRQPQHSVVYESPAAAHQPSVYLPWSPPGIPLTTWAPPPAPTGTALRQSHAGWHRVPVTSSAFPRYAPHLTFAPPSLPPQPLYQGYLDNLGLAY